MKFLLALAAVTLIATAAYPTERRLQLETARSIVARAGVNVGTVFVDNAGRRYAISEVRSSSPAANTFVVIVKVRPL